ncbi:MAG: toxin TcdB middle/N-terminal domain-containing protein, partial [Candidatus Omnitrophota bacterium]
RILEIVSKFSGQQYAKLKPAYISNASNRTLLASVSMAGKDNSFLPAVNFEYYQEQAGWEALENVFPSGSSFGIYTRLLDVNNDCILEILQYAMQWDQRGYSETFIGEPNLTWQNPSADWKPPIFFGRNSTYWRDDGVQFADVNGDGWQDLVKSFYNTNADNTHYRYTYLNNKKNGWELASGWQVPMDADFVLDWNQDVGDHQTYEMTKSLGAVLVDINGDGFPDIEIAADGAKRFYLNTGSGWIRDPSRDMPEGNIADGSTQFADLNADGLVDFFIADGANSRGYINTGNGWQRDETFNLNLSSIDKQYVQLCDINADGLADILVANASMEKAFINTGTSPNTWVEKNEFALPTEIKFGDWETRILDLKGRGFVDVANRSSNKAFLNKNIVPQGYLKKILNGVGGEVEITYNPSSEFDNKDDSGVQGLPFPVYVVNTVTSRDTVIGSNPDVVTTYEYKKGLFDFSEREFRGFGYVKVSDALGNYNETYYHQDGILKGRPRVQDNKDHEGEVISRSENTWQSKDMGNGVNFAYLAKTTSYIYEKTDTPKISRVNFEYDQYGNPSRTFSEGDISVSGDEKTQIAEYVYNANLRLLSLPKYSKILDQSGNIVSQKWYYYDLNNDINTSPTKGLLTKEETWLYNPLSRSEEHLNTKFTYDQYANLTVVTNALGRRTTTAYDNLYHLYPVLVTNDKGHKVTSVYCGINETQDDGFVGSGLPGQLKYSKDPNGQKTCYFYDGLGRTYKVIGPKDTFDKPAAYYEYDLNSRPVKISKYTKSSYAAKPAYLAVYQFYDGLGRVVLSKAPAQAEPGTGKARQIISDIVRYDERGQPKQKYFPYFDYTSPDYTAARYDTPFVTMSYDASGKVVKVLNPDMTYSLVQYLPGQKRLIDENKHIKTEYYDVFGKIIKVNEKNGSQTYLTRYEYDSSGNLVKITDNQANITQIWYDSLGRKIKMDDPDMGVWLYEYDKTGNLIKQTDAKKQVLEFTYDSLNRLTAKKSNTQAWANYYYDDKSKANCVGRLSKIFDLSGATAFYYDELGREIKSIKSVSGNPYTVTRSYDPLGRLMTLKYPDSSVLRYYYCAQGIIRVKDITESDNAYDYVKSIQYSATNQITGIVYGNGTHTDYVYNPKTLRLSNFTTSSPLQGKIQQFAYKFDKSGNVTFINDYINSATQSFVYDELSRLISASGLYGS